MTNLAVNKNMNSKRKYSRQKFHNVLRLFDVLPNFLSAQVKRCAIITYKHEIYELSHELPNDLRPRILAH